MLVKIPDKIPLVSIALCTYNGEKYLVEQLDSLVNQDYPNLEIVAVDDCSNDNTVTILNQYSKKYSFFKVFHNDLNLGYKKNFEKAIQLCNGDYVALSDQDDIWMQNKILKLINNIGNAILIYHDSVFVDSNKELLNIKMSDIVNFYNGKNPEAFLFFNCISSHALLFNKTLKNDLLPFAEHGNHDAWIAYTASNIGSIKILSENLVLYRQHNHSATDILKSKKRKRQSESYVNTLSFLKECSKFPKNRNQENIDSLLSFYSQRKNKIFNFRLFKFFLKNLDIFFPIYKKKKINKLNFALQHSKKITLNE